MFYVSILVSVVFIGFSRGSSIYVMVSWGDVSTDADALPLWLSDGHVLIEAATHIQIPDT